MDLILLFLFAIISWFGTGVDDLLIFSSIYHSTSTRKQKILSALGLFSAVLLMIVVVFTIGQSLGFLKNWIFLGFIIPLYLGIKTLKDSTSTQEENLDTKKHNFYVLSFLGFLFNCSDDIIYNTSIIVGKTLIQKGVYLSGVFTGSVIMLLIVMFYTKKIKDYPKLRAFILFCVSGYILYSGLSVIL